MNQTTTEARPVTRDVYQTITDQIIAAIEAGTSTFTMPWHRDASHAMPINALSGNAYNGVNIVALWAAAEQRGYGTGYWATYRQWNLLGAQVRRSEKSSTVVFYKRTEIETQSPETGEADHRCVLYARASRVFNAEQVDGWQAPRPTVSDPATVLHETEAFVAALSADIRIGGTRACYQPVTDHVQMPDRDRFTGTATRSATESYYAVLLHELTHWTGHARRLDRDLSGRFGEQGYAMEELVAELGAAFLCADLGVSGEPRRDHAAYIASWLTVLKQDRRAIFTAASKAGEARAYLQRLQPSR